MQGAYVSTETGMRVRANLQISIERQSLSGRPVEIQTNSLGYRNPEIGEKDKTRILFLGDSITFCEYLPEEETFVRLIEILANNQDLGWETINASVPAISLQNQLAILAETGLALNPDVVVICFYLNDYHESPGVFVPTLPMGLNNSRLIYHSARMITFLMAEYDWTRGYVSSTRSRALRKSLKTNFPPGEGNYLIDPPAFNALIWKNATDWGGAWSEHAWDIFEPLFQQFKQMSIQHQFQPAIIAFPVKYQVETEYLYNYPQQQLKSITNKHNIPLLDLLPLFRKQYQESDEKLFFDQCHHTSTGNTTIAKWSLPFLKKVIR